MRTVGDILDEIGALRVKQAIYADVVKYLTQFISTDTHHPLRGIKSPIGGEDIVPEDIIDLVRIEYQDQIDDVAKEICKLKSRLTQTARALSKKVPQRKVSKKKAPKRRRKNNAKKKR